MLRVRDAIGSRIEVAGRAGRRLPGVIEEVLESADRERYFRVRRDDGKAVFYFPATDTTIACVPDLDDE